MTPEQAAEALAARRSPGRPKGERMSEQERRRRAHARGAAVNAAKTALVNLHKDEYDALYRVALEQELAK